MWTAEDQNGRAVLLDYSGVAQALGVSSSNDAPVYFVAPGDDNYSLGSFIMRCCSDIST